MATDDRVRELETRMAALEELAGRAVWLLTDVLRRPCRQAESAVSVDAKLQTLQRQLVSDALKKARGNVTEAAALAGMTHRRFDYLRRKLLIPARPWEES